MSPSSKNEKEIIVLKLRERKVKEGIIESKYVANNIPPPKPSSLFFSIFTQNKHINLGIFAVSTNWIFNIPKYNNLKQTN